MVDDRITALEQLAHVQNETLRLLVDHIRAIALVSAAMAATLDEATREVVRAAALASLGDQPEHRRAAALVEEFTRDPATVMASVMAGSLDRLQ